MTLYFASTWKLFQRKLCAKKNIAKHTQKNVKKIFYQTIETFHNKAISSCSYEARKKEEEKNKLKEKSEH